MLRGAPSPSLWPGIVTIKHGAGHPTFSLDGCSCGLSEHPPWVCNVFLVRSGLFEGHGTVFSSGLPNGFITVNSDPLQEATWNPGSG